MLKYAVALAFLSAGSGFTFVGTLPGSPRAALARAVTSAGAAKNERRPAQGPRMFFSTPDIGNLLFAPQDQRFFNPVWFPYFARPTHVEEVTFEDRTLLGRIGSLGGRLGSLGSGAGGAGAVMWMFEQPIGFLNITVNIRMTVVKLKDSSLLVYNPIAPTGQCLWELEKLGRVSHIVLGSTALEHKIFCRSFADKFPDASIYVPPGIFNFIPGRVDLAPRGLGLFVDLIRPL